MRPAAQGAPEDTEPLAGSLLLQVAAREPAETLRLADRAGSGLVLTGAGAAETAVALRRHGWGRPVLADRRRYAGNARVRGTASFAPSWLAGQRDAGIAPVLTDSGYIGNGDHAALRAVLGQAATAGPGVTAVLPLHQDWLGCDRATLIAELTTHGIPVALVLEHAGEPLAAPGAVAGLVELLRNAPSVALLGAGAGALGALAFGAQWAAVGVRGSLRRCPPPDGGDQQTRPPRRRWRPAPQEILAAPVLSFAPVEAVVAAYRLAGSHSSWVCRCSCCRGRTPGWLTSASAHEAGAHTFDVLASHAERLRTREPGTVREQAWHALCRKAVATYAELGLRALGWEPPHLASAWAAATTPQAAAMVTPSVTPPGTPGAAGAPTPRATAGPEPTSGPAATPRPGTTSGPAATPAAGEAPGAAPADIKIRAARAGRRARQPPLRSAG